MSTSLQRGITTLLAQIDAPVATFFSTCVHCGLCAESCLFYTETQDPKYTPIHKLEPMRRLWQQEYTFWGKLLKKVGLSKPVTDEELAEWEPLVYDSCTLCGRCSLACPVGNDITYMVRKMREGMVASGHAPEGLKGATQRAIEQGSPMGVNLKTLKAQIKHAEKETGLTVPLDVEGADYMMVLSSAEVADYPEIISAVTRIFKQADVSWTLASDGFEGTNSGIQIGSSDLAADILGRIVHAAERLKVKYVISPECGHAYTALRWEGPNLIGRPYPFQVIHIIELLDELRSSERLKTDSVDETRMTFHDPCQMVRRGGVIEQPRNLLKQVAPNFVEMPDAGVQNWCCGGGGGVSANHRAERLRIKVFSRKKSQLEAVDAKLLVTSCSNCRTMLLDGLELNRMDVEVIGLTELIADHLTDNAEGKAS
ncbi:MAG: (Fe-S)-binding protein [Gammaproteobacteria bacterium]|nr:(Fe-S)-binding protein [Gammaproteobacteria bacterium]MBU1625030.1 (Fe-S)-binding protein [Gammaproteobacteria bacterium]MBU1981290.1 (Fe-S)-binding protein [Gammaproteobacteria bacterium]